MKKIKKVVSLLEHGINKKLLSSLNESQINSLYERLSEQVTNQTIKVTTVGPEGGQIPVDPTKKTLSLSKDPNKPNTFKVTQTESEMDEDDNINLYSDPDASADGMGMFEEELDEKFESKSQQKYFYARCNDKSLSKEKRNKWCKMADEFSKDTNYSKLPEKKKETKENYLKMMGKAFNKTMQNKLPEVGVTGSFNESQIEKKIISLIEKHLSPKMTKRELLSLLEQGTTEKPITKPKPTTEPKPDTDFDPFRDPDPDDQPEARGDVKTAPTKPVTKPKPSTTPKPDIDYDPFNDPDPSDQPEAGSRGLSYFMKQVKNKGMLK